MSKEGLSIGNPIKVYVSAEWPEEDRKELQRKADELSAALDTVNEKADALMEKMKQIQEISFILSESRP